MRTLTVTILVAAAALLTVPAPNAEAGGLFFRDRAPAYYAPAPAYYAPAPVYYRDRARTWCLFDWFRFDRWSRRW